jgi:hypothetical protein
MQTKIESQLTFEERWQAAFAQAQIPDSMRKSFFDRHGHMPLSQANNRQFNRYFMRAKAILNRGEDEIGCYTMDLSRQGIGLLSPIGLEQSEQVVLCLPQGSKFNLAITRCSQLDDHCYECGGRFIL